MDSNWICVFTTSKAYQAEIIKAILNENAIDAVIIDKKDSSYHFGELEVYVKSDHVIKAKHIIADKDEF
jgi:hypothetical protein